MLYKIDLRVSEITQMGVPLGNVAIFVLGDLMQMCPISGRYIFLNPRNQQFFLTHEVDPLWKKFDVINLEIKHRRGEDMLHPDFVQLNPDDLEIDTNLKQVRKTLRQIQIKTDDERLENSRQLDHFQKKALNVAVNFDIIISRKGKISYPKAPFIMVHGGAGSGKSTLINVISQHVHHILRKDGDDPDCPYILFSAYTGAAAAKTEGQTRHTLFSFNFGAGYLSLSDKIRDEKRNLYKNLKMIIIDEISLVDSDMLYKIDLRVREITQMGVPLGNVAIFVLGDLMQMCPISGRYIFLNPRNQQFFLTHEIDPLWEKFEVINLEINHRQGEDRHYADMLNRIRVGKETLNDIEQLKQRVRDLNHEDIKREKDALFIFGTNKKVNQMNNRRLKSLNGDEHLIVAICLHKTIKNFNPPEGKAGEVLKTPFQK
jgi:energy-coupling factor transporter ATP-binding protein EcfA2